MGKKDKKDEELDKLISKEEKKYEKTDKLIDKMHEDLKAGRDPLKRLLDEFEGDE